MIILLAMFFMSLDRAEIFEHELERDMEIIMSELEYLEQHPININTASIDELQQLPFLSMIESYRVVEYRNQHGPFQCVYDLKKISGFTDALISNIEPFISVKDVHVYHEQTDLRMRGVSFLPHVHHGEKVYGRLISKVPPYTLCVLTEKDVGEAILYDFWAAGIVVTERSLAFALGKYDLDIGPGVMLSPLGSFFSTTDFRIMVRERGIIPYTSCNENGGFFGAALTDSLWLRFTLFLSSQDLDGRIDTSGFARSFDVSGEHVDSASRAHKDRIHEECAGYDVRFHLQNLLIAHRTYVCQYDPPFMSDDLSENFYGAAFFMSGLHMLYSGDRSVLFAEIARGFKDRIGGIGGFNSTLPVIDATVAVRYFPEGFYSPKGIEAKKGERSGIIMLKSRYAPIEVKADLEINQKAGNDTIIYNARLTAERKMKFLHLKVQLRWRYSLDNIALSGSRVFLRVQPLEQLWFDLRLEERYAMQESGIDRGLFGALELGTRFNSISVRVRYGRFDIDSYDARMYIYEIDLPGIVNNRMLHGTGHYGFLYSSVKIHRAVKFSAKFAAMKKDTLLTQKIAIQIDGTF